jgi:hypothetical protein
MSTDFYTMDDLIEMIEQTHPQHSWLVKRSIGDPRGPYMANIFSGDGCSARWPNWANDPMSALRGSYEAMKRDMQFFVGLTQPARRSQRRHPPANEN